MNALWLLPLGTLALSTSVLFIKASTLHPLVLSSGRLWVAVLALSPLYLRDLRRYPGARQAFRRSLWPGVLLALHFASWVVGARLTPVVNSSLLVNMVPLVTPVLLFALAAERIHRHELLGTLIAVSGVLALMGSDFRLAPAHFVGDAVCLGSMLLFAAYLVLARRNRDLPSLWLYLVPLYAVAALLCLAAAAFTLDLRAQPWNRREVGLVVGLGLIPSVLGHSILNHAMSKLRGQLVSLVNLSQVLYAGLLGFVMLGEVPGPLFYLAAVLIVLGALVALGPMLRAPRGATGSAAD